LSTFWFEKRLKSHFSAGSTKWGWVFYGFLIKKCLKWHFLSCSMRWRLIFYGFLITICALWLLFLCVRSAGPSGRASLPVYMLFLVFSMDFSSRYAYIHEKSSNSYGFLINLDAADMICSLFRFFSKIRQCLWKFLVISMNFWLLYTVTRLIFIDFFVYSKYLCEILKILVIFENISYIWKILACFEKKIIDLSNFLINRLYVCWYSWIRVGMCASDGLRPSSLLAVCLFLCSCCIL
jgi:hypothetical protein